MYALAANKPKLVQIEFDKDDENNHHIEFVTAASNLLAEIYDINPADRIKVPSNKKSLHMPYN